MSVRYLLINLLWVVGLAAAEPITTWDNFLTALRRGDMTLAYQCLAPTVRAQQTYRDFCVEWHPLTKNYQAVLLPPLFSEFCIAGDIAYLRLGVREKNHQTADFMYAYLVRENDEWWMVSLNPQLAAEALIEADGRNFLRQLWASSALARQALNRGATITLTNLQQENPRLFAQNNTRRVLNNYVLEIDNLRAGVLRLRPQREKLRGFEFGADGRLNAVTLAIVKPVETPLEMVKQSPPATLPAPAIAKVAPVTPPPTSAAFSVNLPELPPDLGNPDDVTNMTTATAAIASSAQRSGNNYNDEILPEFDERLMVAPEGGVKPTDIKLK